MEKISKPHLELLVFHINNKDKFIAFHRWENGGPGDDVIIVANFANRIYNSYTIGFLRPGRWKVRFNGDWGGYGAFYDNAHSYDTEAYSSRYDNMPCQGNIGIGAYSAVIFSQD